MLHITAYGLQCNYVSKSDNCLQISDLLRVIIKLKTYNGQRQQQMDFVIIKIRNRNLHIFGFM